MSAPAPQPEGERPARYLAIHLPAFRLERCGFDADEVAALVAEQKNATRLVALTPAARAAGLGAGMTAAEARSLAPDVELLPLDEAAERADRAALARACGPLSDRVAFPWPDHLVLEISRTSHLFGGEARMAGRAVELVSGFGHRCRVAVADDPLGAAALTRLPDAPEAPLVVPPGALAAHLAPLPLAALCLESTQGAVSLVEALRAVGIQQVGPFARLDPASVSGRYGAEGLRLHRLARGRPTFGDDLRWGDLDGELPRVSARLAGATSTLQVHFVLPGLLARLADHLASRDLAAVRLKLSLRLDRPGAPPVALHVGVGRPTRRPAVLERLIRARLEGLRLDAPAEELVLEVAEAVPEQGWQPGLTDRAEATEPLPDLLARLRDHLGDDAVVTPRLADSWRPEGAWRAVRVTTQLPREPRPRPARVDDPVDAQDAWERALGAPRPTLLLPEPLPVQVELRGDRPILVRLPEGSSSVARAMGPERLEGEWWDPTIRFDRTYWVVDINGRIAWIFLEQGRWFLHGWFD